MKPLTPKSFEEYITYINFKRISDEYEYFYRGCSVHNWKYNLTPGIYRDGKQITREDKLFREMIMQSPKDFLNEKTALEKLVKMQHYTLPTRLLDITSNPLVAAYFASQDFDPKRPKNGKVYVFKIRKEEIKYYDSDAVSLIANLSKLSLSKSNFKRGFGYLIHEIRDEKPHFSDAYVKDNEEDIRKVFPVKVKLNNNRIVSQSGSFLIFGIKNLNSKMKPASLSKFNIDKEIIIPRALKGDIKDSLEKMAITEKSLFPELEHQARFFVKSENV